MREPTLVPSLLSSEEPSVAERVKPAQAASAACLLVADHSSARIPQSLNDLGLSGATLGTHLACDIGTRALTRSLANRLCLPAVLCNYSRLVVDCNRAIEDTTAFLTFGDGVRIEGNCGLTAVERRSRLQAIYHPYHAIVTAELDRLETIVNSAAIVSIHSFTPVLDGKKRVQDCGVLWDRDPRLALPLLSGLGEIAGLVVGDNEPYSGRSSADFTMDFHGEARGRAHVALEIRQDHLSDAAGIELWSVRLAQLLNDILKSSDIYSRLSEAG